MIESLREPVRPAGSTSERSSHDFAFFHADEAKYRVLTPFIKHGIESGDRLFSCSVAVQFRVGAHGPH